MFQSALPYDNHSPILLAQPLEITLITSNIGFEFFCPFGNIGRWRRAIFTALMPVPKTTVY